MNARNLTAADAGISEASIALVSIQQMAGQLVANPSHDVAGAMLSGIEALCERAGQHLEEASMAVTGQRQGNFDVMEPEGATQSAAPCDVDALHAVDALEGALAKARGVAFVIAQARHGELESEELMGNAIWTLECLLREAQEAAKGIRAK